jgi:AAA15 family ATPase/GTPase
MPFVFKEGGVNRMFFRRFIEMFKQAEETNIIAELKKIESNLVQIYPVGESVFAEIRKKDTLKRLSLNAMGDGVKKMFNLLLYMEQMNQFYMIDEPENGFHYSVQSQFWQLLATAGLEHGKQSFIATHSYELLESLNTLLNENPNLTKPKEDGGQGLKVRIYRLKRTEDAGEIKVSKIKEGTLARLLARKEEIR